MLPPPNFELATFNLAIQECQMKGPDPKCDVNGLPTGQQRFFGGPKHFQESVGGQFKTWWGQHQDFLK